jgi:hypothetical protein
MSRDLWLVKKGASSKQAKKSEFSSSKDDAKHLTAASAAPATTASVAAAAAVGTEVAVPARARLKQIPSESLSADQRTFIQDHLQTAITLAVWGMQSVEQQSDHIQRYDYNKVKTFKGLYFPPDILKMILVYADEIFSHPFTPQEANKIATRMAWDCTLLKTQLSVVPLLQQAVIGGYDRLEELLNGIVRTHPYLLEQKGTVCDHNDYEYKDVTLLQLPRKLRDRDIWVADSETGKLKQLADGIEQLVERSIKACYEEADAIKLIWMQRLEIEPVETSIVRKLLGYRFPDDPNRDTAPEQKEASLEKPQQAVEAFYAAINAIRDADAERDDAATTQNNCGQALATFINVFASQNKEAPAEAIEFLHDKIALREALRAIRMANTLDDCIAAREGYRKHFAAKSKQPTAESEELLSDVMEVWKVNDAIGRSNTDAACEAGLEAMRAYFKAKKVHNNGEELAYEEEKFYRKNFAAFSANDHRQNRLCSKQVIGYLQSLCPAFALQIYAFGPCYLVERGEKLVRSYEFRNDPSVFILPLNSNPSFRIGREYFACGWGAGLGCCLEGGGRRPWHSENLCRAKTSALPVLCNVQISNPILNLSAG